MSAICGIEEGATPVGLGVFFGLPRVAALRQPQAGGRNPFGIEEYEDDFLFLGYRSLRRAWHRRAQSPWNWGRKLWKRKSSYIGNGSARFKIEVLKRGDEGVAAGMIAGFAAAVNYIHPDKPTELWVNGVGLAATHRREGRG